MAERAVLRLVIEQGCGHKMITLSLAGLSHRILIGPWLSSVIQDLRLGRAMLNLRGVVHDV